jgi:hypothetical protein
MGRSRPSTSGTANPRFDPKSVSTTISCASAAVRSETSRSTPPPSSATPRCSGLRRRPRRRRGRRALCLLAFVRLPLTHKEKNHGRTQGLQDRREPEGSVRGREQGQPPPSLLRPEGGSGGATRTLPPFSVPSPRARRATPSATSTSWPKTGVPAPTSRWGPRRTTCAQPATARPLSTPRCTWASPAPLPTRASPRSASGSRRWRRPSAATPVGPSRASSPSAAARAGGHPDRARHLQQPHPRAGPAHGHPLRRVDVRACPAPVAAQAGGHRAGGQPACTFVRFAWSRARSPWPKGRSRWPQTFLVPGRSPAHGGRRRELRADLGF